MRLPAHVEAAIIAHAVQDRPAECCGLLLGNEDEVLEALPACNAADDPVRHYLVDPQEYFQAIRRARERSLQVIGAYHSHPRSSATPSATDRADGFSHFVFLIVGLAADPPEISAWTWAGGNFTALPIVRFT
ncbi:MAG: Mov34/MPN/PAD-1 family protein [Vicinamibacterales bacterium]